MVSHEGMSEASNHMVSDASGGLGVPWTIKKGGMSEVHLTPR